MSPRCRRSGRSAGLSDGGRESEPRVAAAQVEQEVPLATEGLSWKAIRCRSTGRVVGVTCSACEHRFVVQLDECVAIPVPTVVAVAIMSNG